MFCPHCGKLTTQQPKANLAMHACGHCGHVWVMRVVQVGVTAHATNTCNQPQPASGSLLSVG